MVKLKHIVAGWGRKWGLLPTSAAEAALSSLRLRICADCPAHKMSLILEIINTKEAQYVDQIYCTRCKCPCEAKSLVVAERCPDNRW